jgi:hypothetical protein
MLFLAVRLGDWDSVEREATARLDEHPEAGDRALILSNLVVPRLQRGLPVDDVEGDLDSLAAVLPDQQIRPVILDAAGMKLLVAGRFAEAADSWEEAATITPSFASTYAAAARASLWAGDTGRAASLLDRYDAMHLHAPAQQSANRALRAGIAALERPAGSELDAFTAAHEELLAMGLLLDATFTALDAGMVFGPTLEVRPMLDEARAFIDERDATALRARLDAVEAGEGPWRGAAPPTEPGMTMDRAAWPA